MRSGSPACISQTGRSFIVEHAFADSTPEPRVDPTSFAGGWGYCCASGPTGMAAREAIMSDEHLDNLRQARAQLIEQRRVFVRVLAGPYDRGKTEQAREGFMETQAAIEAMDRAIADEEGTRRAVYDRS